MKSSILVSVPCMVLCFAFMAACGTETRQGGQSYESSQTEPSTGDWVVVLERSAPTNLNPAITLDATSANIIGQIFQSLLQYDLATLELAPQLAVARPAISADGLRYTFELNPNAKWPNGAPVSAEDVLFTIKAIKNPLVQADAQRQYFSTVVGFEADPSNPRLITFHLKKPYNIAESSLGLQPIMPRYVYDPDNILAGFTLAQLNGPAANLMANPRLKVFADNFQSIKHQKAPEGVVGSGPYRLAEWLEGQQLVLERRAAYWAQGDTHAVLAAWPDRLVYKIVQDANTAVAELKGQRVDVLSSISPRVFDKELKTSSMITEHYHLHTPEAATSSMICFNNLPGLNRPPLFVDPNVRRAVALLLDVPKVVGGVWHGHASRIVGPVPQILRGYYNDSLPLLPFNTALAAQLLDSSGWKDTNGNGIRDKLLAGRLVEFECAFMVMAGSASAETIAQLLAQNAAEVGIGVDLAPVAKENFVAELQKRNFDMVFIAWQSSPSGGDMRQMWASNQTDMLAGGSNYCGYRSAEADAVMERMAAVVDDAERKRLFWQFQTILYRDQPAIFVASPRNLLVIHKRFRNAAPSAARPGYMPNAFWTPRSLVVYR